jgi:hypothetical protein
MSKSKIVSVQSPERRDPERGDIMIWITGFNAVQAMRRRASTIITRLASQAHSGSQLLEIAI